MSVEENEWIWDALDDFVSHGVLNEARARKMSLDEAHEYVMDSDNRRNLMHVIKYGVTEQEAQDEMLVESRRW
jgi:hypothetical protein